MSRKKLFCLVKIFIYSFQWTIFLSIPLVGPICPTYIYGSLSDNYSHCLHRTFSPLISQFYVTVKNTLFSYLRLLQRRYFIWCELPIIKYYMDFHHLNCWSGLTWNVWEILYSIIKVVQFWFDEVLEERFNPLPSLKPLTRNSGKTRVLKIKIQKNLSITWVFLVKYFQNKN